MDPLQVPQEKRSHRSLIIILLFIIIISVLWGLYIFVYSFLGKEPNQFTELSLIGNYLTGTTGVLFTLAGIAGLIIAYLVQREQINNQKEEIERNKIKDEIILFENNFFRLLDLTRNIVKEMGIKIPDSLISKYRNGSVKGQESFRILYDDLKLNYCIGDFKSTSNSHDLDIKYQIFIDEHIGTLGHYFRSLYHIFKLIYSKRFILLEDEFYYAHLVRAQLTNDELKLLFFNCLSNIAKVNYENMNFKFIVERYSIFEHLIDSEIRYNLNYYYNPIAFQSPIDLSYNMFKYHRKIKNFSVKINKSKTYSNIQKSNNIFDKNAIYYNAIIEYKNHNTKVLEFKSDDNYNSIFDRLLKEIN